jgi:hypothetical protein
MLATTQRIAERTRLPRAMPMARESRRAAARPATGAKGNGGRSAVAR